MNYIDFIKDNMRTAFRNILWYISITAFVFYFIDKTEYINYGIILFLVYLFVIPVICTNKLIYINNRLKVDNEDLIKKQKPRIKSVTKSQKGKPYILLEPTTLLDNNSLVSFVYERDNGFEDIIAIGRVYEETSKGYISIEIMEGLVKETSLHKSFLDNDKDILSKILIKPYLKYNMVEEIKDALLRDILSKREGDTNE